MTKIAWIPPLSLMHNYVRERDYNMFLPQLVGGYRTYSKHIWRVNDKSHAILDNGAFEGVPTPSLRLLELAQQLEITELVVPDVMRDMNGTLQAIGRFTQQTVNKRGARYPRRYMAVVQGTSYAECLNLVQNVARYTDFRYIETFGLPKHLLATTRRKDIRVRLAEYIRRTYGSRYQIHLLGASPLWPNEIAYTWRSEVRSMDTSMPFVYAAAGVKLGADSPPIERSEGYFDLRAKDVDDTLLTHNITTMIRWAEQGL